MLWQAADGVTPLADIVEQRICAAFDVDPAMALRDAEELAEALARHGILRLSDSPIPEAAAPREDSRMSSLMREMGAKALKLGIPLGVQLDLTYRCNERCVHCYLDHDDHGEMTTAEIKDLLDQLADAGVFFLILSGGEIFLRKDLFEIVEHARKLLFSVKLKTNAVMIRKAKAERIAALGVESVQISVYSHKADVHDAITKLPGSFRRTIEGARLLKASGVKVSFANVLMKHNADDYPEVQALAERIGAHYNVDATITPMMDGDRSILDLNIDADDARGGLPRLDARRQRRGVLRAAVGPARRSGRARHAAVQRRPHRLLRLAVRRRLSVRAVSAAVRQRAAATRFIDIWQNSPQLKEVRSITMARSAGLLDVRARRQLLALPGPRVHGRQHARAVDPGLREIVCAHRRAVEESAHEARRSSSASVLPACRVRHRRPRRFPSSGWPERSCAELER